MQCLGKFYKKMEFSFFHRPKPKQFEYKPRFYKGEENEDGKKELTDSERFENHLHESLNRHRTAKPASSPWSTIIGAVACLAFVLYFMCSDTLDRLAMFFAPQTTSQPDFDPQAGFAEEFDSSDTIQADTTTGVYL